MGALAGGGVPVAELESRGGPPSSSSTQSPCGPPASPTRQWHHPQLPAACAQVEAEDYKLATKLKKQLDDHRAVEPLVCRAVSALGGVSALVVALVVLPAVLFFCVMLAGGASEARVLTSAHHLRRSLLPAATSPSSRPLLPAAGTTSQATTGRSGWGQIFSRISYGLAWPWSQARCPRQAEAARVGWVGGTHGVARLAVTQGRLLLAGRAAPNWFGRRKMAGLSTFPEDAVYCVRVCLRWGESDCVCVCVKDCKTHLINRNETYQHTSRHSRHLRSALYNWPAKIEHWPADLQRSNIYLKTRPYFVLPQVCLRYASFYQYKNRWNRPANAQFWLANCKVHSLIYQDVTAGGAESLRSAVVSSPLDLAAQRQLPQLHMPGLHRAPRTAGTRIEQSGRPVLLPTGDPRPISHRWLARAWKIVAERRWCCMHVRHLTSTTRSSEGSIRTAPAVRSPSCNCLSRGPHQDGPAGSTRVHEYMRAL